MKIDDILNETAEQDSESIFPEEPQHSRSDRQPDEWEPPTWLQKKYLLLYGGALVAAVFLGLFLMLNFMERKPEAKDGDAAVSLSPTATTAPLPTNPDGTTATPTPRALVSAHPSYSARPTSGSDPVVRNTPTPTVSAPTAEPTQDVTPEPTLSAALSPEPSVSGSPELSPTPEISPELSPEASPSPAEPSPEPSPAETPTPSPEPVEPSPTPEEAAVE